MADVGGFEHHRDHPNKEQCDQQAETAGDPR